MKHRTLCCLLLLTYPFVLVSAELGGDVSPWDGPLSAKVLEEASAYFLEQLFAQLNQDEQVVQQFCSETVADKERRESLRTIRKKLSSNTIKGPQEYKQLMKELSQITKDVNRRIQTIAKQQELDEIVPNFKLESLKIVIEQAEETEGYICDLLEVEIPEKGERMEFWERSAKLLDAGDVQEERFVELIEKTAQHLAVLAHAFKLCAQSFPPDPKKMSYLKVPNRQTAPSSGEKSVKKEKGRRELTHRPRSQSK